MTALVTLPVAELQVSPGTPGDLAVRVRNTGPIVDHFKITVVDQAAPWAAVTPDTLHLLPGAEETAQITFAVPQGPTPHAGSYVFGIVVRSDERPTDSTAEEGRLVVLPFYNAVATMVPQVARARGGATYAITVENGGNVEIESEGRPVDPNAQLEFERRPPVVGLEPKGSAEIRLTAKPKERIWLGAPLSHSFKVGVTRTGQTDAELSGALTQTAILPAWSPRAAIIAVGAVGALAVGVALGVIPPRPEESPSPSIGQISPTPALTASPTAEVTATAIVTEQPSSAPPATPSLSPEPTPLPTFSLDHAATSYVTQSFVYVCDEDPCRQQVINGMRILATSLEAPYTGNGQVLDLTNFPNESMPVILEADIPFAWTSNTGLQGKTTRLIIDLKPVIDQEGVAYSFFVDDTGTPRRFNVQTGLAAQLADMLYDSQVIVMPSYFPIELPVLEAVPVAP